MGVEVNKNIEVDTQDDKFRRDQERGRWTVLGLTALAGTALMAQLSGIAADHMSPEMLAEIFCDASI